MSKVINTMYSPGGATKALLQVTVTEDFYHATSVTATKGTIVVNLTYDSSKDIWAGKLDSLGEWIVAVSDGTTHINRKTVNVTEFKPYGVSLYLPNVPDGYTELEYIEGRYTTVASEAMGYISFGSINTQSKIFGTYQLPDYTSRDGMVANSPPVMVYARAASFHNHTYSSSYYAAHYLSSTYAAFAFGGDVAFTPENIKGVHTFEVNRPNVIFDGSTKSSTSTSTSALASMNLVLFGSYNSSSTYASVRYAVRWFEFGIYSGSTTTLAYHVIPAISPDNKVGLYDVINNSFYSNRYNNTRIIAGPEKG